MSIKKKLKFVFDKDVLYVKYDRKKYGRYCVLNEDGSLPEKKVLNNKAMVEKIVIERSVGKCKIKNIAHWFENCYRATNVFGLGYLDNNIEDVFCLFKNCYKLEEIDFRDREFNNCRNYHFLCDGCESLKTFKAPNLKIPTNIRCPFRNCNVLNNFVGDINLRRYIPLYDELTHVIYDSYDEFGNKVTKEGKTWSEVFGDTLNNMKSEDLLNLEKELTKELQNRNIVKVNQLYKEIRVEADRCNLVARINNYNGAITYDIKIKYGVDKIKREFKKTTKKSQKKRRKYEKKRLK